MRNCEMVSTEFSLEEVWLGYHSVYINIHNLLDKRLIVQDIIFGIFIEKSPHFIFFKIASKFIQPSFETIIV